MVSNTAESPKGSRFNSLLSKLGIVSGVVVLIVVLVIEIGTNVSKENITKEALSERAVETTTLMSQQMGGALKFGNEVAVSEVVQGVLEQAQPHAVGSIVVNANMVPLFQSDEAAFDSALAMELAQQVLDTSEVAASADGFVAAVPAYFGDPATIAGVVVTQWTSEHLLAGMNADRMMTILMALAVFVVAQSGLIFLMWRSVARPINDVRDTMARVAGGEFDATVPHSQRGDEVGAIAKQLDQFRQALGKAEKARVESAFKGAAFQGSTAPMMLVDKDFSVAFINPACEELLTSLAGGLKSIWNVEASNSWKGADFSKLGPVSEIVKAIKSKGASGLPAASTTKIGSSLIEIKVNAALDEDGNMIGAVVRWSDRTIAQRNSALLFQPRCKSTSH